MDRSSARIAAVVCALAAGVAAVPASAGSLAPIVTVAGNGETGYVAPGLGDPLPLATAVPIGDPQALAALTGGSYLIAGQTANRILRVNANGTVQPFAGDGTTAYAAGEEGASALVASLNAPEGVAAFGSAQLVADTLNHRVRLIDNAGNMSTVAGNGTAGYSGHGGAATSAAINKPVDVEPSLDLSAYYIADHNNEAVRAVTGTSISTVAGLGPNVAGPAPSDGATATAVRIGKPSDLSVAGDGSLLVAVQAAYRVLRVDLSQNKVYVVAGWGNLGNGYGEGGAATAADVRPEAVRALSGGGFLVYTHQSVRRVWQDGTITTLAGIPGGGAGSADDGTAANAAWLDFTGRFAVVPEGLLLAQGSNRHTVRMVESTAIVSGPSGLTNATGATFGRASWDEAATYQCRLGTSGPWGVCGDLSGLADGEHTYQVAATADGVVDPTPAARTWTVDATAPATPVLASPAAGSVSSARPAFRWQPSSDNLSGLDRYELWIDGNLARTVAPCSECVAQPATSLSEGSHTWLVKAYDVAGNVSSAGPREVVVDATQPSVVAVSSPLDGALLTDATPDFAWGSAGDPGSGIGGYAVEIDGAQVAELGAEARSFTPPAALADGAHSWRLTAIDGVGNRATVSAMGFVVDTTAPVAALAVAPERTLTGRSVAFDARASTDAATAVVRYEWDLDGDGSFEVDSGATPTASRAFAAPATIAAAVRVTDRAGHVAVAGATLTVTALAPPGKPVGVSVNQGARYTNSPDVTLFAVWPAFASTAFVSNDGGFGAAQTFPVAERLPWRLDSSGPERLPKTVYVRYLGGAATSETFTDDIILDETAPKVLAATLTVPPAPAVARAAAARTLGIRARDNVSGVGWMQVTSSKRRPGRVRRFKARVSVPARGPVLVRVRDKAKNWSRWRRAR